MATSIETSAPELTETTWDANPDQELRSLLFREQVRRREHPRGDLTEAPEVRDVRPGVAAERAARRDHKSRLGRWENVLVGSIVAVVVMLVTGIGASTGPIRFDDEGTYVSQAVAVLHGHLAPYTYWYDHPPMGWIVLSLWMGGPGRLFPAANPIGTGREFMVLVTGLTTVFMYLALRRLDARRWCAVVACLAFGLSPLSVEFHRMVLLDNIAIMFVMAAIMFAVSRSSRLIATGLCGLSMALAVTSKETTLLMLPFVVWMLWRTRTRETRGMSMTIFSLTFLLPVLYYPLLALLKGELLPGSGHVSLWDGISFQLFTRKSSGSIFTAGTDAHSVVLGWFHVDWYLLLAGAIAAPLLVFQRRRWALLGATLLQALMLVRPGYLPVPFVLILLPLAAMCLALGLDQVSSWIMHPFGRRLAPGMEGRSAPRITVAPSALWQRIVAGVAAVALAITAAVLLPHPLHVSQVRDHVYMHDNIDLPYQEATGWIEAHVPAGQRIVSDNVIWTDLVDRDHRDPATVVWFTKLGVDSAVVKQVPTWRQIDYVVSSDIMRTTSQADSLEEAISHSKVVASYGQGGQRIEIRKVEH